MSDYPRAVWVKVDGKVHHGYTDWGPDVDVEDRLGVPSAAVPGEQCQDPDCAICALKVPA